MGTKPALNAVFKETMLFVFIVFCYCQFSPFYIFHQYFCCQSFIQLRYCQINFCTFSDCLDNVKVAEVRLVIALGILYMVPHLTPSYILIIFNILG